MKICLKVLLILFVTWYLLDWYKIQDVCDKVLLENDGMINSVTDYKNKKICNKPVDSYAHALELVQDYYNTQKMCC